MKKFVAILLLVAMVVTMSGCFKSEEAQLADDKIAEIGKVTLSSYTKINEAEQAINDLEEKDRKHLDNLGIFEEAKEEYSRLLCEDASKKINEIGEVTLEPECINRISTAKLAVEKLDSTQFNSLKEKDIYLKAIDDYATLKAAEVTAIIDAIGTVTLNSGEAIENAKKAYNALDADAKQKVTNYSVLTDAEKTLSELRVNRVNTALGQLANVSLQSRSNIDEAKTLYSELNYEEKQKVDNYNEIIDKAEDKIAELEKAEEERIAKAAIGRLKTEYDKVEGITWYYAKCKPYYADTRCYVLPYIGKRDSGYTWMNIRYHYTGDRWVFYDTITIVVDGEKYYKSFDYGEVSRDNDSEVWEVAHEESNSSNIAMLEAIANSRETIVRFEGDDKRKDFTISAADKQGIKDVLAAYEYMK